MGPAAPPRTGIYRAVAHWGRVCVQHTAAGQLSGDTHCGARAHTHWGPVSIQQQDSCATRAHTHWGPVSIQQQDSCATRAHTHTGALSPCSSRTAVRQEHTHTLGPCLHTAAGQLCDKSTDTHWGPVSIQQQDSCGARAHTHWKHMQGSTVLACVTSFHLWKVLECTVSLYVSICLSGMSVIHFSEEFRFFWLSAFFKLIFCFF